MEANTGKRKGGVLRLFSGQLMMKVLVFSILIQALSLWGITQFHRSDWEKPGQTLGRLIIFLSPQEAQSDVSVFGPKKYVRTTGKPDVFTDKFSATAGGGKLIILNGDESGQRRISSAIIQFNGNQIFGPSDFNQSVYRLERNISLASNNTLKVELRSGPNSYLTIQILAVTQNHPPIANAGPDQSVYVGDTVQLDGSKSSDVDGDPLTFKWSFNSIPSGSSATLLNPSAVNPTFVADKPGTYVVQLIVNDGKVDSDPSTTTITANLRMVTVPNVVGMAQGDAQSAIAAAKLIVGAITQANSATVPVGSVISQNPLAGTLVAEGSSVSLVISTGPVMVSVPNVVGMTQAVATSTITSAKLAVGAITEANSATVPVGSVISQNPAAGISVPEGSSVDLVVSLGPVVDKGTPPTISDLLLSRTILPVPREYEQFIISLRFNFSDPNMDIQSCNFTLTGPSGLIVNGSGALTSDQPMGSGSRKFIIDSSFVEGSYQVGVEVLDAMGNSSGIQTKSFTIDPAARRFLEITAIEPSSGKPGDRVAIKGTGFEADPPANGITFEGAPGGADVLSGIPGQLEVIVPPGAKTGTVRLMTSQGRTDSPEPFAVVPTISLSPTSTQLLTGSSTDFSCVPGGTDTYGIVWSINGQTPPDPSLGAIDNRGHFTAPSSLPSVIPLTLRCTSADVPTLYAEASITVVAPAPMPGQDLVKAATGGQMTSTGGEVTISILPGSMASDTVISVAWVNPDTLPLPTENSYNLAAVKLEPTGLEFSQPVTVIFSLKSWQQPGTILAVYLADGATGAIDTGKTAIVDETGLKASTTIEHFSTYFVSILNYYELVLVNRYLLTQPSDVRSHFNEFSIYTSEERPFLEGLLVPIVVRRGAGPGPGIGPFLATFYIHAILEEGALAGTELQVPTVQPSRDGWEIGATIGLPVMPDCNEGNTRRGRLSLTSPFWGSASISIPFTIQCLNELSFSRWTPPEHVPEGAWVDGPADDGTVTVNISTGTTYRFSELSIGEGGILKVNYTQGADPAVVEVTGNVSVQGEILSTGGKGSPGENGRKTGPWYGEQHIYGGSGGSRGFPNGGDGGSGAPYNGIKCEAATAVIYCTDPQGTVCSGGNYCACTDCYGYPEPTTCAECSCAPLCYYEVSDNGETGHPSPVINGGMGGLGGHVWNPGSGLELLHQMYNLATALRDGPMGIVDAVEAGVGLIQEGWKIFANAGGEAASAGLGGYGPSQGYPADLSSFSPPLGGGGGGGAGKLKSDFALDIGGAGGGGGGGGGGAPSLKLVTAGRVTILNGGSINGRGGNGGPGGTGSGGLEETPAGGGGGGGGNGAEILIIAGEVINNGTIDLKRGLGGASAFFHNTIAPACYPTRECGLCLPGSDLVCPEGQYCLLECGEWDFDCTSPELSHVYCVPNPTDFLFVESGIGAPGKDGVLRVDGNFSGTLPQDATFYHGLRLPGPLAQVTSNPQFCEVVWEGQHAWGWCFNLQGGLNVLTGYRNLHPWQKQFVFYYPGRQDSDGDGLSDSVELMLGTNPNNSDSDGDGLTDFAEVVTYRTDPLKWDTDGDGYSDGYEVAHGTNPKDPSYSITVTKAGAGGGLVTSSPSGLDCGLVCQATFLGGARVTLQASPSAGSYFAGWTMGGYSTTNPSFGVWVNADANIVATFEVQKRLTVVKKGSGTGVVTSTPSGLDCGSTCQATFPPTVTLHASPSSGSYFAGWSGGGCSGTNPSCTVNNLIADTTAVATFELQKTLTVTKTGAGSGLVTSTPSGIDCGSTCQATYTPGANVTLTATASPGSQFAGWTGGGCSGTNRLCSLTINADTTVAADFEIFVATGSMTTARANHTATLLSNGKVLIAGGYNSIDGNLSSAELYDPATSIFTLAGSMTTKRADHTATLNDWEVLIAGGTWSPDFPSSAESYNIATETFGNLQQMVYNHNGHTATPLVNGWILFFGGWRGDEGKVEYYFDGCFFPLSDCLDAREYHTATLLTNGKVLIAGGDNFERAISSADLYDNTGSGVCSATSDMLAPRENHTATLLPNGKVLIAGGYNSIDSFLSSAEIYDPDTESFTETDSMTIPRETHTATLLPNGKVLIAGGYNGNGASSSAELYDPATQTFTATGSMTIPRETHTATLLPNGKVLIAGGWNFTDGSLSSAELYDPASGTFSPNVPNNNPSNVLTVTKAGSGSGAVTSTPIGVDCGATCQAIFTPGTMVTLQATASPGSYFTGWSGSGCSGTNPSCTVTVNADTTVIATFQLQNSLTVTKTGTGSGLVTSTPSGVDCGSTCQATFPSGTVVTLQASPSPGSYFAGWSGGACSGTNPSCVTTIAADTTVVAIFQLQNTLTVSKTGSGSGLVTSTPSGVDCGSTCQATFTPGTMITLQAVSSPGSYFAGWSGGGCSGTDPSCTITLAADTTVVATFQLQKILTVTKAGAGSGLVTSTPPGLDCGSTCQATYTPGTNVTLTATPSPGSQFAGWSGGGCSGTDSLCIITIDADTTIVASFEVSISTASMTTPRGTSHSNPPSQRESPACWRLCLRGM